MSMRGRNHPRGAAAVEFALVLPLLMVLVMGTIEWGRFFFLKQVVVNSAREGARAGSEAVDGYLERARAVTSATLSAGALDPTKAVIDAVPGTDSIIVTVSYPVPPLTGLGIPVPAVALGRAEMRR
jgi:Flp pilus assembly protein TadG